MIENGERIPIDYIQLIISGATQVNASFNVDGGVISMPPWINVSLLSELNPNYGYGYGYYYYDSGNRYGYDHLCGYGYDFGYGYGYVGVLRYLITINTDYLNVGAHTMQLTVVAQASSSESSVTFDFEADNGGFTQTNDWEWGAYGWVGTNPDSLPPPSAHSGSNMWGTVLNNDYNNIGDWSNLTYIIDLTDSSISDAQLNWWDWYDLWETWDHGEVYVNGVEVLDMATEYIPASAWIQEALDLSPYIGSTPTVMFSMYATTVVSRAGWYIDDVVLTTTAPQPVYTYSSPIYNFNISGFYIPHLPIRINSNADFDEAHGVVNWATGNGTVWSPWIIEGWDINGTGYGYCIYIGNTTEYFDVKTCSLHNADGLYSAPYFQRSGLHLYNVQNGHLTDNQGFANPRYGIYLDQSNYISLIENKALNNGIHGIGLTLSDYCTLKENSASNNSWSGISLVESSYNIINNNTANWNYMQGIVSSSSSDFNIIGNNTLNSNVRAGIYLFRSHGLSIHNNSMVNNGIILYGYSLDEWNTHNIDNLNNVNGKPVIYWKNITGGTIPSGAGQVLLANCTNVIVMNQTIYNASGAIGVGFSHYTNINNNTAQSNFYYGAYLVESGNNTISHNNFSSSNDGFDLMRSDYNTIHNNTATVCNWAGIHLEDSIGNVIINNSAIQGNNHGIYLHQSSKLNTLQNNLISYNGDDGIYLYGNTDDNNIAKNQVISNYCGLHVRSADNNNITNNIFNQNTNYGILLDSSIDNSIKLNNVSANDRGIYLYSSSDNRIFHNNFGGNADQAFDNTGTNFWDNGYPSGGNYWSDYNGTDIYSGPGQNQTGSDGIGDTPYDSIQGGSGAQDNYPLMGIWTPPENETFEIPLSLGWNLISLPLIQYDESINAVLSSIAGKWDYIQAYNTTDPDHWRTFSMYKPGNLNDLSYIDHKMSFWIHITEPNVTLSVQGNFTNTTNIQFFAGWNLIGYPTLTNETVGNAFFGTSVDRVMVGDTLEPYNIKEVGPAYVMKPGEGYWVHAPFDTIWVVDW